MSALVYKMQRHSKPLPTEVVENMTCDTPEVLFRGTKPWGKNAADAVPALTTPAAAGAAEGITQELGFPHMQECPPGIDRNSVRHPNAAPVGNWLVQLGGENWTEADYENHFLAKFPLAKMPDIPTFKAIQPYIQLALLNKQMNR